MTYEIVNLINSSNNNDLSAPTCISFDLKNGDKVIGTCQFTLENILLHVEVVDDRGNQFSFKPGKELEKEKEPSKGKEVEDSNDLELQPPDMNTNRLGLGELVTIKSENSIEVVDDRGNQFSFKPGKELEKEKEKSLPETERRLNSPDIVDSIKLEIEDDSFVNPSVNNEDSEFTNIPPNDVNIDCYANVSSDSIGCSGVTQAFNLPSTSATTSKRVSYKSTKCVECEVCGKTFTYQSRLNVHLRRHNGEKPFNCEVCGKKFARKDNLQDHMRSHTGEKPFPCEVCGRSFSQKSHLSTHIKIHTDFAPFKCHLCEKRFTTNDKLKLHLFTHADEGHFSCRVCGK